MRPFLGHASEVLEACVMHEVYEVRRVRAAHNDA